MEQRQEQKQEEKVSNLEDLVLKAASQAFGESVIRYLGQEGTLRRAAPTEHVHLEVRNLLEDFNFEMEEGFWRHYEFESDRVSVEDMRRFREYEAYLSMNYKVPVITTVLCSARVKKPRSKLKEGINTYRVESIQLKERDADKVFKKLQRKLDREEVITKDDLVPVLLTPLMSGKSTVYERIVSGFQILKKVQGKLSEEDVKKMQAILYAFACKFLEKEELKRVRKETSMTILGQMLMEDGIAIGEKRGIAIGMEKGMEKGVMQTLIFFVKQGTIAAEDAAKHVNLSREAFLEQMRKYILDNQRDL